MSDSATYNPYSHLSTTKRFAKIVLKILQKFLPSKAYDALYFPAYRIYHNRLSRAYGKKLKRLEISGDKASLLRTQRVYSVLPYSLIGTSGLEHTHDLALNVIEKNISGAFVECGVARGGCAALIAKVAETSLEPRSCWFFDSYEGLPDPTSRDFVDGNTGDHIRPLPKGSCLGAYEQVAQLLFNEMHLSRKQITLVKGWFQDTLPKTAAEVGTISLLRVDGDWYDSTRCCLDNLFDQVSPGGHIIIDDYFSCYGARQATDEFLAERGIKVTLTSDGRGGCSFQKPMANENTLPRIQEEAA